MKKISFPKTYTFGFWSSDCDYASNSFGNRLFARNYKISYVARAKQMSSTAKFHWTLNAGGAVRIRQKIGDGSSDWNNPNRIRICLHEINICLHFWISFLSMVFHFSLIKFRMKNVKLTKFERNSFYNFILCFTLFVIIFKEQKKTKNCKSPSKITTEGFNHFVE